MKTLNYKFCFALFLLLVAGSITISAQVAINTDGSLPDGSAILDLKSTNRGLLLPRMTTGQRTALANIQGLTVFDTDLNTPMYNTGTSWQPSSFNLPYVATLSPGGQVPLLHLTTGSAAGYAIKGETTSNGYAVIGKSVSGYGIYGESNSNTGIYGYTNSGIAGYFQAGTSTATALAISGKVNSNGTTGSNGSVLSINVSGFPTWQEPVAFAVNDLGPANLSIPNNTDTKFVFANKEYDLGNDFNLTTSEFTAPVKGIYHFDAFAYWPTHTNGTGYVAITLKKNNAIYATVRAPAFINEGTSNALGVNMLLNAGDKVTYFAYQNSGAVQTVFEDGRLIKLSGFLVMRQ